MLYPPKTKNQQVLIKHHHDNQELTRRNSPSPNASKSKQKLFLQRIASKIQTQPQDHQSTPSTSKHLIKPKSSRLIKPFFYESVTNLTNAKWTSMPYIHHQYRNGVRMTLNPLEICQRKRSALKKKRQDNTHRLKITEPDENGFHLKLNHQMSAKLPQKKYKQAPSFIKNKFSQFLSNNISIQDFEIIKKIEESQIGNESLALHKKTCSIFNIKLYQKFFFTKNEDNYSELKFNIKNNELNHSTIAKCFGFFSDQKNIYVVQEYLEGVTIEKQMENRIQGFSQTELGAKICDIMSAITYLHSKNYVHGSISKQTVVNSLNICKLKRPSLKNQKKDHFYDIWCLGNLAFEMATHQELIPASILSGIHSIDEIFQSNEIAKCIEVGFKRFQNGSHSRDLIHFLITTLWTVQHKKINLQQLWQEQFIKLFKDDDQWQAGSKNSDQSN